MVEENISNLLVYPGIKKIASAVGNENIRLVGGCVRDALMDLPVNEVDIATSLRPDEVMAKLTRAGIKVIPTGIIHGTITAVVDGQGFEITTLRKDVSTDGRWATVAFTDDWQADAARRDFTINALYVDFSGKLYDYFDGLKDLKDHRIKFIGDAAARIREDYLRILRFFRFYALFSEGRPDKKALDAIDELAPEMKKLSGERIHQELFKLFDASDPLPAIKQMVHHHIFTHILEDVEGDVKALKKIIELEEKYSMPKNVLRRFAAFMGCEKRNILLAQNRLKLSNQETQKLLTMCDVLEPLTKATVKAAIYKNGNELAFDQLLLSAGSKNIEPLIEIVKSWQAPIFDITGDDLKAKGLREGSELGLQLKALEQKWVESDYQLTRDQLLMLIIGE